MSESVFADRIVQNLLDTDFYKLTMMQAVLHNYPNVEVEWEFRCRNSEDLRPYLAEIRYQFERLAELSLSGGPTEFPGAHQLHEAGFFALSRLVPLQPALCPHRHRKRRAVYPPARAVAACDPV